MNLKQIEAFVRVADLGSFRKAAAQLNTTQPNISARIAALEDALDVRLMHRDAGSVRLTVRGRDLLDHARMILRACDGMVDAAGATSQANGVLRLGVTEMVVQTWLRDFLRGLKDAFPNVLVELTVDLSVNLERDLADLTLDLALQNAPFRTVMSGDLGLGIYPLIWVAAPALVANLSMPLTTDSMAGHPILTHARDTQHYVEVTRHFRATDGRMGRVVPSNSMSACIHMALDAMGVAIVPAAAVIAHLQNGTLVALPYDWHPTPLEFHARYDAERTPGFVAGAAQLAFDVAHDYGPPLGHSITNSDPFDQIK